MQPVSSRAAVFVRAVNVLVMAFWPVMIWLAVGHDPAMPPWLLLLLAFFFLWRGWHLQRRLKAQAGSHGRSAQSLLALAGAILCIASWLLRQYQLLLFYPVLVNLALLCVFGSSLFSGVPVVEKIARIREPDLSPEGVAYTRRVTQIWCGFFMINGSIALATCLYNDMTIWALWNGILSYICMGTLMGGEWLVRQRIKRP